MPTTDPLCAPGQGRTAWLCTLVATCLVFLTMTVVLPLLVRAGTVGDGWCLLGLVAPFAAALVHLTALAPGRIERRGRLLTARTPFGRRTVDLDRLTRVGHVEIPGQPSPVNMLLLTDAHGVRLAVEPRNAADASVLRGVKQAVQHPPRGGRLRVSNGAREYLWPQESASDSCLGVLFGALLWTAKVIAVVLVAGGASLALSLALAGTL
ncbi:hypothetical protein [Streptomyces sp. ODS28]|uniref:hypothetical protein n=1 Tax=Streptomyces sp. ODS28 TaxID=3136688 RepID=UPI0031EC6E3D